MLKCEWRQPGRMEYAQAFELQQHLVAERKAGAIPDQFIPCIHPKGETLAPE